jgi:hypothetical protein
MLRRLPLLIIAIAGVAALSSLDRCSRTRSRWKAGIPDPDQDWQFDAW